MGSTKCYMTAMGKYSDVLLRRAIFIKSEDAYIRQAEFLYFALGFWEYNCLYSCNGLSNV